MNFREADSRYADLKRQYDNGSLSAEEFDAQLKRMMVEDDEGRWWAKSRETGEWHYYDGSAWVRGTPPEYETRTVREPPPQQRPQGHEVSPPGAVAPGHLMPLSILTTLFCCLPTGIAAIVYSAQANSKSQAGDTAGASRAAKNANIWLIVSVVAGLMFWFFVLISNNT